MPREEAESLLGKIRAERPDSLCAQRDGQYVEKRHSTEALLRREFAARGGIMEIESPHYMVVEFSPCRASLVRSKSMRSSGVYSSRLRVTCVKESSFIRRACSSCATRSVSVKS